MRLVAKAVGKAARLLNRIIQKKTMMISYNAVTVIKNTAGISD
jgi:hypothetical protein